MANLSDEPLPKVVLHAGLHKSGTTAVQASWLQAYSDEATAWYPPPGPGAPGHHRMLWPLLDAFREGDAPDLAGLSATGAGLPQALARALSQAQARGTEVLVLSSEELDRMQQSDRSRTREAFRDVEVTTLLTVTRPIHRWASGWQELVKHGLAQYPSDAARHVLRFANLEVGRLEELAGLLPGRLIVRLVGPPESDLPAQLATLVGLPTLDDSLRQVKARNQALGVDIELLRRINEADLAVGTVRGGGLKLIERLRGAGFDYRTDPDLAVHYEPPPGLWDAATAEQQFLSTSTEIEVHDPHGLLDGWTDRTPPDWYQAISTQEARVSLPPVGETAEHLWRVRLQRAAFQGKVAELKRRL